MVFIVLCCRDVLRWGKNIVSSKTKTKKRAGAAVYNRASSLETLVSAFKPWVLSSVDINLAQSSCLILENFLYSSYICLNLKWWWQLQDSIFSDIDAAYCFNPTWKNLSFWFLHFKKLYILVPTWYFSSFSSVKEKDLAPL